MNMKKWMLSRGKSFITIEIHLRNLRSILNMQIAAIEFSRVAILLKKRKYQYPQALTLKKL